MKNTVNCAFIQSLVTMEIHQVLLFAIGISAIGALWFLYLQLTFWKRRGIPCMEGVPLIGNNAPIFFRRISFPEFGKYVYNLFPNAKYFGMMDFNTPVILLRDPEIIKQVCVKNFDNFPDHRTFFDENMDPLFGKNLFFLRGERWKEMRTTLSPSFTSSKMKFMFQLVSKCSNDFVKYLRHHPEQTISMEMKDTFSRYTNDVIATAAFGISVNSLKEKTNEFYLRGKDATNFSSVARILKFILFRVCPNLMKISGASFLSRGTTKFFKDLMTETVKTRDEQGIVRPDMIHLMMQARYKENGINMTTDDIIAQAFIFFLAGFDTSSTLMCFIAHELAVNPDIQEKLRKEVNAVVKDGNGEVSYEALHKMKYLDMVISEALRKYPPAPFTDRLCTKSFQLPESVPDHKPFDVQPGTVMSIPIYGLHHDPNYFPNPDRFDPERFSDEEKDKIVPYTYMPFGLGPRICIGNRFALMETKIILVHLLMEFALKPCEKTLIPLVLSKKSFAMQVEGGFWMQLEPVKV